jgi:C1A family cysteine protease
MRSQLAPQSFSDKYYYYRELNMSKSSSGRIDVTQDPQLNKQYNPNYVEPNYREIANAELKNNNVSKFNWVPDKIDTRDYKYRIVPAPAKTKVDLRSFCSPIEHQYSLGSCTGQAIASAIEYLDKKDNNWIEVSRLYIYYYTRLLEGNVNKDSGAYIRTAIKSVYNYGAPRESLWPYNIKKFKIKPSKQAISDAHTRKVTLYERVLDFNGCINALDNGYPVTIGFYVYSSFQSRNVAKTGIMPYPNINKEKLIGGHAVLLVGYDKTNNYFIARNSWGAGWGDKGYFYMPFQVIQNKNMSADFWVIKSVNNQ